MNEHDEMVRAYFSGVAPSFAAGYTTETRQGYVYVTRRELVANELRGRCGGKLLDVGCGAGVMSLVAEAYGYAYTGIDSSPEMVRAAERVHPESDRVRFGEGRAEQLDFGADEFDVVLALGVLEYVERFQVDRVLSEIERVVKPGGTVIVSVLSNRCPLWVGRRLREAAGRLRARLLGRRRVSQAPERLYSKRQIGRLLAEARMTTTSTRPYAFAPIPASIYARWPGFWARLCGRVESLHRTPLSFLSLATLVVSDCRTVDALSSSGSVGHRFEQSDVRRRVRCVLCRRERRP